MVLYLLHYATCLVRLIKNNMKYFYIIFFSVCVATGCSSKLNYDLGYAAVVGNVEKMRDLIANGAEVNSLAGKDETSPLEDAINGGHIDAVKFLLENGADPNFSSSSDISPLFHAFSNGNTEIASLLINYGAKLKLPNRLDGFNDDIRRYQYDKNFLTLLKKAGYIYTHVNVENSTLNDVKDPDTGK